MKIHIIRFILPKSVLTYKKTTLPITKTTKEIKIKDMTR